MSDVEANKRAVVGYYELAFNEHKPREAVEQYVGSEYIQHNPQAPDGPEAFVGFVEAFPEVHVDIRRVVGDGDIVVTHSLIKFSSQDERERWQPTSSGWTTTARSWSTGTLSSHSPRRVRTTTRCSSSRRLAGPPVG